MEAFMDWWLVHRDEDEVLALADDLPKNQIKSAKTTRDNYRTVVTLEVIKKG